MNFPALFSVDGTKLFVINSLMSTRKPSLREWDLATGRETGSLEIPESVRVTEATALSPDGTQSMGLVGGNAESWRLDLISGRVSMHNLNTPQPGPVARLSPAAKFLAVPSQMGFIKIFDNGNLPGNLRHRQRQFTR